MHTPNPRAFAILTLLILTATATTVVAKEPTTIPLNVGFGPALFYPNGALGDDQSPHYGVRLYMRAIISGAIIKKNKKKIPKKLRGFAKKIKEARVGYPLIPDALFLSPQSERTSMYGATWRPLAADIPLVRTPRLSVGSGILLTYAHIHTDLPAASDSAMPEGTTNFFRPGLDLRAELEIPLSRSFLISGGWSSAIYIPQELHGDFMSMGSGDRRLWHIGQAFFVVHFRFPYKTKI